MSAAVDVTDADGIVDDVDSCVCVRLCVVIIGLVVCECMIEGVVSVVRVVTGAIEDVDVDTTRFVGPFLSLLPSTFLFASSLASFLFPAGFLCTYVVDANDGRNLRILSWPFPCGCSETSSSWTFLFEPFSCTFGLTSVSSLERSWEAVLDTDILRIGDIHLCSAAFESKELSLCILLSYLWIVL